MGTRKVIKFRGENDRADAVYFTEVVRDGVKLSAHFGTTDKRTKVTTRTDRFGERAASIEHAIARFDELVAARANRYESASTTEVEVPEADDTLDPGKFDDALEAEVLAARDPAAGKAAATVYADWLQQQGDVRGELASLWIAGQEDDARAWLRLNPTKLFGDLDVQLDIEIYDLVWDNGFLRGASIKRSGIDSIADVGELTKEVLALPVARLVTELRYGLAGYENDNDWSPAMQAITESHQAKQIRVLRFDDYTSEDSEISWTAFGDFSAYWPHLPALEDLRIRAGEGGTLGEMNLPNLRKFVRVSGGLGADEIDSIVNARWPKLEHLEVWFGRKSYGAAGTVEMLAPLLDGRVPKTLAHLGLCNCEFVGDLIEPLAKSPVLRQLKTLDLSKGTLTDEHVDLFLRHADAFRHLDRIDLSENLLAERAGELHARLVHAVVAKQRPDDPDYRYAALGE